MEKKNNTAILANINERLKNADEKQLKLIYLVVLEITKER